MPTDLSRRERLRDDMLREVRRVARRLVAEHGTSGLTVVAVGKAVGVTPPALYRYFEHGRAELLGAVYRDSMDELIDTITAAVHRQPQGDVAARLHAPADALFRWCRSNPREFDLLMGSAYDQAVSADGQLLEHVTQTIGPVFLPMFIELWEQGFDYPANENLPPELLTQLRPYLRSMLAGAGLSDVPLPLGVAYWMVTGWRQVYGLLCMAVYDHIGFAFADHQVLFDDTFRGILQAMGLQVSPDVVLER